MTQQVMGFHYTLTNTEGTVLDSSEGGNPLLFLAGTQMIIPGLEEKVLTMSVGDKEKVQIAADDAYGQVREDMLITVKRDQFPEGTEINEGDSFRVNEDPRMPPFQVMKIDGDEISLNGNHPLAGMDLTFDVEITEKRDATEEEIAHGHAHGVGGHQHD